MCVVICNYILALGDFNGCREGQWQLPNPALTCRIPLKHTVHDYCYASSVNLDLKSNVWHSLYSLVCCIHDIDPHMVIWTHLSASAHDVIHWGNAPKWYRASFSHSAIKFTAYFNYAVWLDFIHVEFYICLRISAHGLLEWFMLLCLSAQVTYVNALH